MKFRLSFCLVLLVLLLAGCSKSGATFSMTCGDFNAQSQGGGATTISVGETLTLTLCANPTTGFQWEPVAISDESVLKLNSQRYEEVGATNNGVGAAGQEVWVFEGLKPGQSTINLAYSRPWEGGEKAVWTCELEVTVK
ncbi:MAG: protease inhibitor I42 family protein [Caldilineales bacterium]|nr:protease inhibitor I42 family protein [Caldilineales bacterium]